MELFKFDDEESSPDTEFRSAIAAMKAINRDALLALPEVERAFQACLAEKSDAALSEQLYRSADTQLIGVRTRRHQASDALETPLLFTALAGLKDRLTQENTRYAEEKRVIGAMRLSKKREAAYAKSEENHLAAVHVIETELAAVLSGIELRLRPDQLATIHVASSIRLAVEDAARDGSQLADAFGQVNTMKAQAWDHVLELRRTEALVAAARAADSFSEDDLEGCIELLDEMPLPERIISLAEFNPAALTLETVQSYPTIGYGAVKTGFGRHKGKTSAVFESTQVFEDEQGRLRNGVQCQIGVDGKLTVAYGEPVEAWVRRRDRTRISSVTEQERAFLIAVCKAYTTERARRLPQAAAAAILGMIRGINDVRGFFNYAFAIGCVSGRPVGSDPVAFAKQAFKDFCETPCKIAA